ncbi:MAG: AGE family epimerase/isomerase [Melioribacteraceae bacterium]|nr:AGE family epimerase/isomerase [Melioribacteraceae bacterium]MCF8265167.1 AGE family epimerase/isomerase [Melioribacteraceae bacterium]MCF8431777.1 AGE family epimerase/isomerase [Melioribacteraceae bacterium]
MKLDNSKLIEELRNELKINLLGNWYPLCLDYKYGGYFSNISRNWEITSEQEKMIVTQARHIWTCAKASKFLGVKNFADFAEHGFKFLEEKMWDHDFGGFFQIRNHDGELSEVEGLMNEKRMYGNAFAIYGLAALYEINENGNVLALAQKTFDWIEQNSFDPKFGGYFQFFTRENSVFDKESEYKTKATDAIEVGYKDQNSSIHLMEAYSELYHVYKSPELKQKLNGILELIRDKMTNEKGYLHLFFERDFTPVSFVNSPKEIREENYRLDHVSFGHDYETAFLMLEASYVLGIEIDTKTLSVAKKMVDHALEFGWDKESGGFFEEGYYLSGESKCTIVKDTKNWWAQAEAMNIFLLMSQIFPSEKKYEEIFYKSWEYIKKWLLHENGGWYWGSLEKEPFYKTEPEGSIWKGTYHTSRALMNCITMLSDKNTIQDSDFGIGFHEIKTNSDKFIRHWRNVASTLKN